MGDKAGVHLQLRLTGNTRSFYFPPENCLPELVLHHFELRNCCATASTRKLIHLVDMICETLQVFSDSNAHRWTLNNTPELPLKFIPTHTKSRWQYHKHTSQIRINSLNKHFHLFLKLLAFRKENKKYILHRWELCVCVCSSESTTRPQCSSVINFLLRKIKLISNLWFSNLFFSLRTENTSLQLILYATLTSGKTLMNCPWSLRCFLAISLDL